MSAPDGRDGARPPPRKKKKRKALTKTQRHRIDAQTAKRLTALGQEPLRPKGRVFEDIEVELGRKFVISPYRERWAFAIEGGRRSARVAAEFDLFKCGRDHSNARHFVLRPKPRPRSQGEPSNVKATLGELDAELRRFADDYNRWTDKIIREGLISPLIVVVHVRFDQLFQQWDIHAHCLWNICDSDINSVNERIQSKFSTVWYDIEPIRNVGALVNYFTQRIVDYLDLKKWPDGALLEFWGLNGPRLVRPAGEFAKFRRKLEGCTLDRKGDEITVRPKTPRPAYKKPLPAKQDDAVIGYVRLKFDGIRRLCSIREFVVPSRASNTPQQAISETLGVMPGEPQNPTDTLDQPAAPPPTTSTGLTPPIPPVTNPTRPETDSARSRVPLRKAWWAKAWPWAASRSRLESGPIKRRLFKLTIANENGRAVNVVQPSTIPSFFR